MTGPVRNVLQQRRPVIPTRMVWMNCNRCERPIPTQGVPECFGCLMAAEAVWPGIGVVTGEMSGA